MNALSVVRGATGARFWILWTLGSVLGWIVGFFISLVALGLLVEPAILTDDAVHTVRFDIALTLVFGASGAGLGVVQWLLLRRHLEHFGWWIAGAATGFLIVATLYALLNSVVDDASNEVAHNVVGGAVTGLLQWLVVRGRFQRAGWWVPTNAVGFVIAGNTAAIANQLAGIDEAMAGIVGMLLFAMLTGGVMIWLLRHPLRPVALDPRQAWYDGSTPLKAGSRSARS